MKIIKKIMKRIVYKNRYSSESYSNYLRKKGCKIGEGTTFFSPTNTVIDETRPWMIELGKNVQITEGVTILTHGYDWSVIKGKYGDILGSSGKVKIGNNVFIGVKSTILKGVTIGDNVIIGANSLVNKDIPSDVVVAGNPAKVIMSIEEYYMKRQQKQLKEAEELFYEYYKTYDKIPDETVFREYIEMFIPRDNLNQNKIFNEISQLLDNQNQTYEAFMNRKKMYFDGYNQFVKHCKKKYRIE